MEKRHASDIQSNQVYFGEILSQNSKSTGVLRNNTGPPPERRSTIGSMVPCRYQNTRIRNLSGGSNGSTTSGSSSSNDGSWTQLDNQYSDKMTFPLEISLFSPNSTAVHGGNSSSSASHKKLDRSWSDTDSDRNGPQKLVNSSRYKTELCRPFEESGSCKYGDKCQFAHGYHELRNLTRHPKYKTELCRTFHTVGFCPYGPRCHFIHEEENKPAESPKFGRAGSEHSSSGSSSPSLSPMSSDDFNMFFQPETNSQVRITNVANHLHALTTDICALNTLEKRLSSINLNYNIDNSNTNNPKPRVSPLQERDIFSEITMFNSEDVLLDNATSISSCAAQSMKIDNFSFMDNRTPTHWQSSYRDY